MPRRLTVLLIAAAAVSLSAERSRGAIIPFTSRAAFQAAASPLTTINFNDQPTPSTGINFYPTASVTLSGVTFSNSAGILFPVSPSQDSAFGLGDGTVLAFAGPELLRITLPAGTFAVGMDFGSFVASTFTFSFPTGETFVLPNSVSPTTTPTFAGFISTTTPIASLTVTSARGGAQIDRFVFGSSAVPEPASLALLGLGGLGFGLLARRRMKVV